MERKGAWQKDCIELFDFNHTFKVFNSDRLGVLGWLGRVLVGALLGEGKGRLEIDFQA